MEKKKKLLAAAVCLALLLLGGGVALAIHLSAEEDARGRLPVYFFNAAEGQLQAELRVLPQEGYVERIEAALRHFVTAPVNTSLSQVWPAGVEFRELIPEIYVYENILVTTFSDLYSEMPPVDEILFRSAFTLTMTGLPYIEGVLFRVPGYDYTYERPESAATIANNPFISSARRTAEEFTLYFVNETGEGLLATLYEAVYVDVHTRAVFILELLIGGQNDEGILPLIPPETIVREVLIEPDAGIYVNLSGEFHSRFGGTTAQARLMLQSITHTMLENIAGTARNVFFLIDSERWDYFHGVDYFNQSFTVDENILVFEDTT